MHDLQSLVQSLRSVRHFAHLADLDLQAIVASGQMRCFREGETIFADGEPCAGMFVLLRGLVHLCKMSPLGQVTIISVISPIIMFNEVAVLDGGPNPVTALAAQECWVWQVSHAAFQDMLKRHPALGLGLLRVLAKRQRHMLERYEDLSFRSVLARVAKLLLDLSRSGKTPIDRHAHSITEMAARIASGPEAVSRSLNALAAAGAISANRAEILILHPDLLADFAQLK